MQSLRNFLFAIFLMTQLVSGCSQQDTTGVYGSLEVVRQIEVYKAQVALDSNMLLVNLADYIPGIILDIRYATDNNFVGVPVYKQPLAFARYPVAKSLLAVQQALDSMGLGLVIFDAYRPYSVTVKFFEIYPDSNFVAHPSKGSRHNRGCAVDVALVNKKTGRYLEMPTDFDDFSEAAYPDYLNLTEEQIQNRQLLIEIMARNGFTVYPTEWWHFDFVGWKAYPLMDIPFEKLNELP
jgi:D-alanyl-D-alanine dipeptidase